MTVRSTGTFRKQYDRVFTRNRHTRKARLAFRVAGYLTLFPYSIRLSLLVDRLVMYAEGKR